MRVKYFCTQAESFDSRQTPGLKRACIKCEHKFYCITTKFVRVQTLGLSDRRNKQVIAALGNNWSSHVYSVPGEKYNVQLKYIEEKFGIDLHLDKAVIWQKGDGEHEDTRRLRK